MVNNNDKCLLIIRGLPGSGKSSFAKIACDEFFEADMYFLNENGDYIFDKSKLKLAHEWCYNKVSDAMIRGVRLIGVSNTFTMLWEFENYIKLSNVKDMSYMFFDSMFNKPIGD